MNGEKSTSKRRGIYERVPGSGVWWIQYTDAQGRRRREKAGLYSSAEKLLDKRHTEALQGKKLPETLRAKPVTFGELLDDALEYSKSENGTRTTTEIRIKYDILRRSSVRGQQRTSKSRKSAGGLSREPRKRIGSAQP